jgi:hypothetical protein
MHFCHVNSTSLRHIDRVLELVARSQAEGLHISTEAYPYGSGMTGIGAGFLTPRRLAARGIELSSVVYTPTGERVPNAARLQVLRESDPGGLAVFEFLDEHDPEDQQLLMRSLMFPNTIVASDAMPLTQRGDIPDPLAWPPPSSALTHPRTAGTFSKALRLLTRDAGKMPLLELLGRVSLLPARLLETAVPAMRVKGRVQPGCDADLVVFDPATVTDQATYGHSTRVSRGFRHVLVGGSFVIRDSELVPGTLFGQPIRAEPR